MLLSVLPASRWCRRRGGLLLWQTIRVAGLAGALWQALTPWRGTRSIHDPGKVLLDVVTAVALGGDCLADVAVVRARPGLFATVACDPTISRLVATVAGEADAVLAVVRDVRAGARAAVWTRRRPLGAAAGHRRGGQVVVDIDATLVTAHSDKEGAEPTFRRGFGFAPMCAFVDHGEHGTGEESLAVDLRPGGASPWNSADHIATLDAAVRHLPEHERGQVRVRADTGGASKAFVHHVADAGLEYPVGFAAHKPVRAALEAIPEQAWQAAIDADGQPREGAQIAELTGWMPTPTKPTRSPARFGPQQWPEAMRVIARRERPHPGRSIAADRPQPMADHLLRDQHPPRSAGWPLADLQVRHRQPARCEDRIHGLKDTGLPNLPFHGYAHNRIWVEIIALAADPLTWTQTLAWAEHEPARRREPKRLRLRVLAVAGQIVRTGRRRKLRLPSDWIWDRIIDSGWSTLQTT